jgi:hypothetical protein
LLLKHRIGTALVRGIIHNWIAAKAWFTTKHIPRMLTWEVLEQVMSLIRGCCHHRPVTKKISFALPSIHTMSVL